VRAWALLTWWVVGSGCVGLWRRAGVESRLVREHYAVTFVRTDLQSFERLWNSLDWSAPMGCLSLVRPCRITPQNDPPTELIPRDAVLLTARLELSSFDALAPVGPSCRWSARTSASRAFSA